MKKVKVVDEMHLDPQENSMMEDIYAPALNYSKMKSDRNPSHSNLLGELPLHQPTLSHNKFKSAVH